MVFVIKRHIYGREYPCVECAGNKEHTGDGCHTAIRKVCSQRSWTEDFGNAWIKMKFAPQATKKYLKTR